MSSNRKSRSSSAPPPADTVKSPPFVDCSDTAIEAKTDEDVFVMDITKKETFTTTLNVSRDKTGKLRYSMSKHSDCEMDGLVNSSPTVRDRVRQDSLMSDFLPELGQSKREGQVKLKQSKDDGRKQRRRNKRRRYRARKKKRMEKVHEERECKTNEVLVTRPAQTSSTSSGLSVASQSKASQSSGSLPSSPFLTGVYISTSKVHLPIARRSEICVAPRPIDYEVQLVSKSSAEPKQVVAKGSPVKLAKMKDSPKDVTSSDQPVKTIFTDEPINTIDDDFFEDCDSPGPSKTSPSVKSMQSIETSATIFKSPSAPCRAVIRLPPELKHVPIHSASRSLKKINSPIFAQINVEQVQAKVDKAKLEVINSKPLVVQPSPGEQAKVVPEPKPQGSPVSKNYLTDDNNWTEEQCRNLFDVEHWKSLESLPKAVGPPPQGPVKVDQIEKISENPLLEPKYEPKDRSQSSKKKKFSDELAPIKSGRDLAQLSKDEINFLITKIYQPSPSPGGADGQNQGEQLVVKLDPSERLKVVSEPQSLPSASPSDPAVIQKSTVVTVQSSEIKLNLPQTVAAPFENAPLQNLADGKIARHKSSTALHAGLSCYELQASEPTSDAEVDALLVRDDPEPKAQPSHTTPVFEEHLRFYQNQEKFFATMREMKGQPEVSTKERPIESKDQLVAAMQNLVEREDAFVRQVKESGSLGQIIGPTRPIPAAANVQDLQPKPQPSGASTGNLLL